MTGTILPFRNRMPEDEFERRWKEIVDTYGTTNKEAIAKRDRATAMFLADSGWGIEEIAARIGRGPGWVSLQLNFADFLVQHNVEGKNLTEFAFRKLWIQTRHLDDELGGKKRIADREATPARYAEVARMLKEQEQGGSAPKLSLSFVEPFSDGKWHRADKMAADAEMSVDDFVPAMRRLTHSGSKKFKIEQKQVGMGAMFRIFRNAAQVSTAELREKLKPFLDELKNEGKKDHIALASFKNVLRLAILIERQIDSWEQGE